MIDVDKAISSVVKTGKVVFGANSAVKNAQTGKAKLIVIAANCPAKVRGDIEYYSKLSELKVLVYNGTSIDLGMVCGKPFMVSALSIKETGDSDILKVVEKPSLEEDGEESLFGLEGFVEEVEDIASEEELSEETDAVEEEFEEEEMDG